MVLFLDSSQEFNTDAFMGSSDYMCRNANAFLVVGKWDIQDNGLADGDGLVGFNEYPIAADILTDAHAGSAFNKEFN